MNEIQFAETVVTPPTPVAPIKMKFNLICASKCKKFALEIAKSNPSPMRAKKFTRVGQDFLMACETQMKEFIRNRVKTHPSKGKTLM